MSSSLRASHQPCNHPLRFDNGETGIVEYPIPIDGKKHARKADCGIVKDGKLRMISWLMKQNPMKLTFTRDTKTIIESGDQLKNNYAICHWPDNRILAQCKEDDSVLLTRDMKLLQSADFAGIMACKPKDFGGFVSVS